MAREQSPAFQFYPQDFLADDKVMAMNSAERGVYITLLCHCWLNHELPHDAISLRRMAGYEGSRWEAIWLRVRQCFHLRDGKLIQPRIEREREKQAQFRAMKAKAGQAGGKQKASNKASKHVAKPSPPSSSSSSSPSPSSSSIPDSNNKLNSRSGVSTTSTVASTPTDGGEARSGRVIFKRKRLVVHEWQLDDCMKMLGQAADAFGLDEWFDSLDKELIAADQIAPPRDGGVWLRAKLMAEASKRGVLLAIAKVGPQRMTTDEMANRVRERMLAAGEL